MCMIYLHTKNRTSSGRCCETKLNGKCTTSIPPSTHPPPKKCLAQFAYFFDNLRILLTQFQKSVLTVSDVSFDPSQPLSSTHSNVLPNFRNFRTLPYLRRSSNFDLHKSPHPFFRTRRFTVWFSVYSCLCNTITFCSFKSCGWIKRTTKNPSFSTKLAINSSQEESEWVNQWMCGHIWICEGGSVTGDEDMCQRGCAVRSVGRHSEYGAVCEWVDGRERDRERV